MAFSGVWISWADAAAVSDSQTRTRIAPRIVRTICGSFRVPCSSLSSPRAPCCPCGWIRREAGTDRMGSMDGSCRSNDQQMKSVQESAPAHEDHGAVHAGCPEGRRLHTFEFTAGDRKSVV